MANQAEGAAIQGLSRALYERLAFTKDRDHQHRLGDVPDPAHQGRAEADRRDRHAGRLRRSTRRAAARTCRPGNVSAFNAGWASTGAGEPPTAPIARRDRERVLRRHGCPHPRGADGPGSRPCDAQGRRGRLGPTRNDGRASRGPPIRFAMSRSRSRSLFAAALVAALALSLGHAARAAIPSLYANYATNCTFAFVGDGGTAVSSVAPGTYQVVVDTPFAFSNGLAQCEYVQFRLTGPGVNFDTDLGGGDIGGRATHGDAPARGDVHRPGRRPAGADAAHLHRQHLRLADLAGTRVDRPRALLVDHEGRSYVEGPGRLRDRPSAARSPLPSRRRGS